MKYNVELTEEQMRVCMVALQGGRMMGKKYVIELEEQNFTQFHAISATDGGIEQDVLYRVKGFSSLVFDEFGLNKLEELNSDYVNEHFGELQAEAYQKGQRDATERKRKQIEKHKRRYANAVTLRDVLVAMEPESPLPDEWTDWDNFTPQSVFKIMLCFMSEEETWIEAYRDHVMLIPWYSCKVLGFNADEKYTMNIWLDYDDFLRNYEK